MLDQLLALLTAHQATDNDERAMTARTLEFVRTNANCCERSLAEGHITGSAWIVDAARRQALLVHHAKLNRWLQPGGHADGSADVLGVALREAREETGLASLQPVMKGIFDVDVHPIPARGSEAAHLHYDIRFLIEADVSEPLQCSAESHEVRWFELGEIAAVSPGASIERMVGKTVRLKPSPRR